MAPTSLRGRFCLKDITFFGNYFGEAYLSVYAKPNTCLDAVSSTVTRARGSLQVFVFQSRLDNFRPA